MEIHEHAIDRYIERVLELRVEQAGDAVRDMARDEILKAAQYPNTVYHEKEDEPPIHIKQEVAVPVDGDTVPTTYRSITFKKKMDA